MNYQPLILTCDCGYRTPETYGGKPITERRAREVLNRHVCIPGARRVDSRHVVVPCVSCGEHRIVRIASQVHRQCPPCASKAWAETLTARNADTDDVVVERLVSGVPVPSTPGERRAAIERLTRRGLGAKLIARRIGVSWRTVQRLRAAA